MARCFIFITISIILLAGRVQSETLIPGGDITGTWALDQSPFIIEDDVSASELIIEPGVVVKLTRGTYFRVHGGGMRAEGTPSSPVVFTSAEASPSPGDWQSIQLAEDVVAHFDYCHIEYATIGISVYAGAGACDIKDDISITISNCTISHCKAFGLLCSAGGNSFNGCSIPEIARAKIVIDSCQFSENMVGGIMLEAKQGEIFGGGRGHVLAEIIDNVVKGSRAGFGVGLYRKTDSDKIECNMIGNTISNNGIGIHLDGYLDASSLVIDENDIFGNDIGIHQNQGRDSLNISEESNAIYGNIRVYVTAISSSSWGILKRLISH